MTDELTRTYVITPAMAERVQSENAALIDRLVLATHDIARLRAIVEAESQRLSSTLARLTKLEQMVDELAGGEE